MATKTDVRFLLNTKATHDSSGKALAITASAVVLREGKVRNPYFGFRGEDPGGEFDCFKVSAQTSTYKNEAHNRLYGYSAEFGDVYRAGLQRVESMVKLLRRLNRSIEKIGHNDFASFMAALAASIPATTSKPFGISVGNGLLYDDNQFVWMNTTALRDWLDARVAKWATDYGVVLKAS